MTRRRDIATLFVTGMFAGCSPVVDRSNSPDASIDAADTSPPALVRSNPATMGSKFSVIQPITLTFDEPLDPASISAATIALGVDEQVHTYYHLDFAFEKTSGPHGFPLTQVRGTVAYDDASRTITFTPVRPLSYGKRHTLSINVKDVYGNTFDEDLNFVTFVNGAIRETQLRLTPNLVLSYGLLPPDANGFIDKHVMYSPGNDGQWFTGDDFANQLVQLTYDAVGHLTDERLMAGGNDGLLDTPDDTTTVFFKYLYDAMGQPSERVMFNNPGPDMAFDTNDDVITFLFGYSYTAGTPAGYVWYNDPGTDTLWRTADDRCVFLWDYTFDEAGNKTRETFKGCGTDALPRTADDTFRLVHDYAWNANNELIKVGTRTGPGTDAVWLTNDDDYSLLVRSERDASGLITSTLAYGDPGVDKLYDTTDDVPNAHTRNTYAPDTKLLIEVQSFNDDGVDGMFGTEDDVQIETTKTSYDELGNRVDQRIYRAGDDAMFNTADDRVLTDWDYDTSH